MVTCYTDFQTPQGAKKQLEISQTAPDAYPLMSSYELIPNARKQECFKYITNLCYCQLLP